MHLSAHACLSCTQLLAHARSDTFQSSCQFRASVNCAASESAQRLAIQGKWSNLFTQPIEAYEQSFNTDMAPCLGILAPSAAGRANDKQSSSSFPPPPLVSFGLCTSIKRSLYSAPLSQSPSLRPLDVL